MIRNFRNSTTFVTGSRNGTVSIWERKNIVKSIKILEGWTLVFHKDGCIFALSKNSNVFELNMNLEPTKKFHGHNAQPATVDASEDNLVVGYGVGPQLDSVGYVDVHSRKQKDQIGHQIRVVCIFLKFCDYNF